MLGQTTAALGVSSFCTKKTINLKPCNNLNFTHRLHTNPRPSPLSISTATAGTAATPTTRKVLCNEAVVKLELIHDGRIGGNDGHQRQNEGQEKVHHHEELHQRQLFGLLVHCALIVIGDIVQRVLRQLICVCQTGVSQADGPADQQQGAIVRLEPVARAGQRMKGHHVAGKIKTRIIFRCTWFLVFV